MTEPSPWLSASSPDASDAHAHVASAAYDEPLVTRVAGGGRHAAFRPPHAAEPLVEEVESLREAVESLQLADPVPAPEPTPERPPVPSGSQDTVVEERTTPAHAAPSLATYAGFSTFVSTNPVLSSWSVDTDAPRHCLPRETQPVPDQPAPLPIESRAAAALLASTPAEELPRLATEPDLWSDPVPGAALDRVGPDLSADPPLDSAITRSSTSARTTDADDAGATYVAPEPDFRIFDYEPASPEADELWSDLMPALRRTPEPEVVAHPSGDPEEGPHDVADLGARPTSEKSAADQETSLLRVAPAPVTEDVSRDLRTDFSKFPSTMPVDGVRELDPPWTPRSVDAPVEPPRGPAIFVMLGLVLGLVLSCAGLALAYFVHQNGLI